MKSKTSTPILLGALILFFGIAGLIIGSIITNQKPEPQEPIFGYGEMWYPDGDYLVPVVDSWGARLDMVSVSVEFSVDGTVSISTSLYIDGTFSGAGLSDCDNATTSKLLWDITGGKFSCGTDNTGTGMTTHNLLSEWHDDTTEASASQGSLIKSDGADSWIEFIIGASDSFPLSDGTDFFWNDIWNLTVNEMLTVTSGSNIDSGTFYVDSANDRIGIGTTEPTFNLSVDGTVSASDDWYWGDSMLWGDVSSNEIFVSANVRFDDIVTIGGDEAKVVASESFAAWAIASVQYDLTNYWGTRANKAGTVTQICGVVTSGTSKEAEILICDGVTCGDGGSVDSSLTLAVTNTCDDGSLSSASFGAGDYLTASVSDGDDSGGTDGITIKVWVTF